MVVQLTDETFAESIKEGLTIVDFWAEWCGPCKMVAPIIEDLAEEYAGKVTFAKVNVDLNSDVSIKFGIRSIPTLLFFRDGIKEHTVVGALPKAKLSAEVDKFLQG